MADLCHCRRLAGNPGRQDSLAGQTGSKLSRGWAGFRVHWAGCSVYRYDYHPYRGLLHALRFPCTGVAKLMTVSSDMGHELIQYPVFNDALRRIDNVYADLGCTWSIFGKVGLSSCNGRV